MSAAYDKLLKDICVRLGFCGSVVDEQPLQVDQFLPQSGPLTDEDFADAIFKAEGWDPDSSEARRFRPSVRDAFVRHMGGSEIDANLAACMDTPEDLRLDREHLAHLLYECRDGLHPATQENEADLQRELEELDAKIARLTSQAYQCCFCAQSIERPDLDGVRLSLVAMGRDPVAQDLFAHITCLATRFAPTLAPETPFDAGAFEPE